jgi:hypothetical protein
MSRSTLTQLDPREGLAQWLRSYNVADRIKAIVVHHTEEPTGAQYEGRSTIEAIRSYHMQKGWSDIGAQLYTCPDGMLFTGRPLDAANYCHAGPPWRSDVEAEALAISGGDTMWFNHYAIGIETVANFDLFDPWGNGPDARSLQVTLEACATICRVFSLDPARRIFFHRDVADKTCPGMKLTRVRVREEVARRLQGGAYPGLGIVRLGGPGGDMLIPCDPEVLNGATWVALRPVVEALGGRVDWSAQTGPVVRGPAGEYVDVSAFCVLRGDTYRCPLRPLIAALGWQVKEPPHLDWVPPRIYLEPRPVRTTMPGPGS